MNTTLNRILLVEDDLDIQSIARLALELLGGFTVEVCSRGQEALDKVSAFDPDMIVLDADPLADITNSRKIDSVWMNGKQVNRDSLAPHGHG